MCSWETQEDTVGGGGLPSLRRSRSCLLHGAVKRKSDVVAATELGGFFGVVVTICIIVNFPCVFHMLFNVSEYFICSISSPRNN